jgi:hypothetical protein
MGRSWFIQNAFTRNSCGTSSNAPTTTTVIEPTGKRHNRHRLPDKEVMHLAASIGHVT